MQLLMVVPNCQISFGEASPSLCLVHSKPMATRQAAPEMVIGEVRRRSVIEKRPAVVASKGRAN